jgi:hypothetical protein
MVKKERLGYHSKSFVNGKRIFFLRVEGYEIQWKE